MLKRQTRINCIIGIIAVLLLATLFLPRYSQPQSYHDFADQREFLGIPNAFDVLSNVPIFLISLWGLSRVGALKWSSIKEKKLWFLFFLANIFVAIFSAYYHLKPDNFRLVLDRLAISVSIMSFFSLMLQERLKNSFSRKTGPILVVIGILSVLYWIASEQLGHGDLRPYGFVQLSPIILIIGLIYLFPIKETKTNYIILALVFFVLSKFTEHFDKQIFLNFNQSISGHTLKHIFVSLSLLMVVLYIKSKHMTLSKTQIHNQKF